MIIRSTGGRDHQAGHDQWHCRTQGARLQPPSTPTVQRMWASFIQARREREGGRATREASAIEASSIACYHACSGCGPRLSRRGERERGRAGGDGGGEEGGERKAERDGGRVRGVMNGDGWGGGERDEESEKEREGRGGVRGSERGKREGGGDRRGREERRGAQGV